MSAIPHRVAIIMAGGSGERFWPLSRTQMPKQLLRLTSQTENMLEEAVARIAPLVGLPHVYVQTSAVLAPVVREHLALPPENILAEPHRRNTAGCLAYATAHFLAQYGNAARDITMGVVTADHHIPDREAFRSTLEAAMHAAETEPALVTIGIVPSRPATGFGYIQVAEGNAGATRASKVLAFHEKPAPETALEYLRSGNYFWNSGMFFWRIGTYLDELAQAQPAMEAQVHTVAGHLAAGDTAGAADAFARIDNISIDYALMEKARQVAVVPASFPWDDVGTWAALERTGERDHHGNTIFGEAIAEDSRNCILYNGATDGKLALSVIGVEDLVVVATHDAVLVVPKSRSEEVRRAVQQLRDRGHKQI